MKARRAKIHLNALHRSIEYFIKNYPYNVTQNNQNNIEGYQEYFIQRKGVIPKKWGLLVGDFAHNLRSSLDYLAWQINIRTSNPVKKEHLLQFPICDTEQQYIQKIKGGVFPEEPHDCLHSRFALLQDRYAALRVGRILFP